MAKNGQNGPKKFLRIDCFQLEPGYLEVLVTLRTYLLSELTSEVSNTSYGHLLFSQNQVPRVKMTMLSIFSCTGKMEYFTTVIRT